MEENMEKSLCVICKELKDDCRDTSIGLICEKCKSHISITDFSTANYITNTKDVVIKDGK